MLEEHWLLVQKAEGQGLLFSTAILVNAKDFCPLRIDVEQFFLAFLTVSVLFERESNGTGASSFW